MYRTGIGIVLVGLLLLGCDSPVLGPESPPRLDEHQAVLVSLVNQHREGRGCRELVWSDELAEVARNHARDMAENGFFGHRSSDGSRLSDRLARAGISFQYAGENIAAGQDNASWVFERWLESPDHRENVERCGWTRHGLGYYHRNGTQHTYYWVHVMLR